MLPGSILHKLKESFAIGDTGRSLSLGVYFKNTLVALCHALEDAVLEQEDAPLLITAFQRGKWYLQEAERYQDIAQRSRHVTIMASPDAGFQDHPTGQLPNVSLVGLDDGDPVTQEWHLIIVGPEYTAMVLCQELSDEDYGAAGMPQHDLERKFYGLWTFDPSLVHAAANIAIAHISRYNTELADRLRAHLANIEASDHSDGLPNSNHIGDIVTRVVHYMQTSQEGLFQHDSMGFDAYPFRLDKNLISNELQAFLRIAQLIDQTDLKNPMAAAEVATLAETLGQLLDLPAWQLNRLRLAGLLHRIASLSSTELPLPSAPSDAGQSEAEVKPLCCPLIPGTQMLRRMNRMKAIATILNHMGEAWDGSGFPARLSGDEIPLESRILGLVSCFQQRLSQMGAIRRDGEHVGALPNATPEAYAAVLAACEAETNHRWDPKLMEALTLLVSALQQGLSLSVSMPQVASGLWLLDSHSDEDLLAPPSPMPANPL
ncbi:MULTISPECIES: DICT sensory domain-containing protein [unclassified Leptolyngbya]|uniref:DICT sensory domain-containing protein n=1 Tax=unclassified Leptolyngbya TaxID=2650499 RepID=UPI001687AB21|nr:MULTISPECIES: DICT sensory domain-containing protein [unclassified Leptolyngbya]MBD1911233.1 metal-dependent phosphohydrolase [Leptolyngbya sp. FACHB-8]MBD2155480.1 metal-dependent phosphohydrolase [Leptolyngbya sp. FACHB-16]